MNEILTWSRFFCLFFISFGALLAWYGPKFWESLHELKASKASRFVLAMLLWFFGFYITAQIWEFSFSLAGCFTLLGLLMALEGFFIYFHFNWIDCLYKACEKYSNILALIYLVIGLALLFFLF